MNMHRVDGHLKNQWKTPNAKKETGSQSKREVFNQYSLHDDWTQPFIKERNVKHADLPNDSLSYFSLLRAFCLSSSFTTCCRPVIRVIQISALTFGGAQDKTHDAKSNSVKSGDIGGHGIRLPWPIHLHGQRSWNVLLATMNREVVNTRWLPKIKGALLHTVAELLLRCFFTKATQNILIN